MYWLPNGKTYHGNWYGYQNERLEQLKAREGMRIAENHTVKPNLLADEVLKELKTHEYYYIYEAMESGKSVSTLIKEKKLTESKYDKQRKEFFLLFYTIYSLKGGQTIEIR